LLPTVQVLLSTYNGEKTVERQINSILKQAGVRVNILVRDDGSIDNTQKILRKLQDRNPERIELFFGSNLGWRASFFKLMELSGSADFFAFSDQDDIWFANKLSASIAPMKKSLRSPEMVHVQSLEVDENLQQLPNQRKKLPEPLSFKMAVVSELFQGCSMVWNRAAMDIVKENLPSSPDIPHDFWTGLICYLVGDVQFVTEPQFYHIRYSDNSSTDGNILKGRVARIKKVLKHQKAYINPCRDLLHTSVLFSPEERNFFETVTDYKEHFHLRMSLVLDKDFRRPSSLATLLLKAQILLGQY